MTNGPLSPDRLRQVDAYFEAIPEPDSATDDHWLSYIAIRHNDQMVMLAGTLRSNMAEMPSGLPEIHDAMVRAGTVQLSECHLTPRRLVEQAVAGQIDLSTGSLAFPTEVNSATTVFYRPDINYGTLDGRVENVLQISGVQRGAIADFSAVNLALKAYPGFHNSLQHLLLLYRIRADFRAIGLWLVTAPIVEMGNVKALAGSEQALTLTLRPGFDKALVTLGVNYTPPNQGKAPFTIDAKDIVWTPSARGLHGSALLPSSAQEEVECIAIYDRRVQHIEKYGCHPLPEGWFGPATKDVPPTREAKRPWSGKSAARKVDDADPDASRDQGGGSPSMKTVKHLFALSGNLCAFPGCSHALVVNGTTIGEICHIKAANPEGPRYDETQTRLERHGFQNLILLCGTHHTEIDDDGDTFTVEVLTEMKARHEQGAAHIPDRDAARAALQLLSVNQSGGITAGVVNAHTIVLGKPEDPSPPVDAESLRAFFAPELSRVLVHQVWVLDRLIANFICASADHPAPGDKLVDFKPKRPSLYPSALEFRELPAADKTLLAEFYDSTTEIDETIAAWGQSDVPLDFNSYNVLMQGVQHTVALGIAAAEVFCPDRLFKANVPVIGTLVGRAAEVIKHAREALNSHLQRRGA